MSERQKWQTDTQPYTHPHKSLRRFSVLGPWVYSAVPVTTSRYCYHRNGLRLAATSSRFAFMASANCLKLNTSWDSIAGPGTAAIHTRAQNNNNNNPNSSSSSSLEADTGASQQVRVAASNGGKQHSPIHDHSLWPYLLLMVSIIHCKWRLWRMTNSRKVKRNGTLVFCFSITPPKAV